MWKRLKIPTTPSHRCTNGFSKLRIQVLTVSQGLQQTLPLRIRLLLSYWYQWMTLFVFDWQGSFLEYPVTWMITNKIGWIMICQNIYKNISIYIYTRICIIVFMCFQAYLLISYTSKPVLLTCPSEDFWEIWRRIFSFPFFWPPMHWGNLRLYHHALQWKVSRGSFPGFCLILMAD